MSGYTDYDKEDEEKVKFKANLMADSVFFFSLLLIVFAVLNLLVDWFKLINEELDGMVIILLALFVTVIFYILLYFYRLNNKVK